MTQPCKIKTRSCLGGILQQYPSYLANNINKTIHTLLNITTITIHMDQIDQRNLLNGEQISKDWLRLAEFSFNLRFISKLLCYAQTKKLIANSDDFIDAMFQAIIDRNTRQGLRELITECLCSILYKNSEKMCLNIQKFLDKVSNNQVADPFVIVASGKALASWQHTDLSSVSTIFQLFAIVLSSDDNSDRTKLEILEISSRIFDKDIYLPIKNVKSLIIELCRNESCLMRTAESKRQLASIINCYSHLCRSNMILKERHSDLEPRVFSQDLFRYEISSMWTNLLEVDQDYDDVNNHMNQETFY